MSAPVMWSDAPGFAGVPPHQMNTNRFYGNQEPAQESRPGHQTSLYREQHRDDVEPCCSLYVHNVPKGATEEELRELFCKYGNVEKVRLKINTKIGPHAVYAFVTFEHLSEARAAMENLDGYNMRE
eukprot:Selendium_serpulae@DN8493_c0_g1_i2.p1